MTLRPKRRAVVSRTVGLRASARTFSLIFQAFFTRCQCQSPDPSVVTVVDHAVYLDLRAGMPGVLEHALDLVADVVYEVERA